MGGECAETSRLDEKEGNTADKIFLEAFVTVRVDVNERLSAAFCLGNLKQGTSIEAYQKYALHVVKSMKDILRIDKCFVAFASFIHLLKWVDQNISESADFFVIAKKFSSQ